MLYFTIQIQDFGFGYTKWKQRFVEIFRYSITTFGMIYQIHNIMNYTIRSSDLLMSISKQTYGINNRLLPDYEDWQTTYVPHGISQRRFNKVEDTDTDMLAFNDKFGFADKKFRVLYSNRNIRRKMPGDVVLAFKYFVDGLPEEERDDCVLIFHCAPSDPNGTDLPRVCRHLMPDYNVAFTYTINNGQPFDDKSNESIV